jgi:hypothetical protein
MFKIIPIAISLALAGGAAFGAHNAVDTNTSVQAMSPSAQQQTQAAATLISAQANANATVNASVATPSTNVELGSNDQVVVAQKTDTLNGNATFDGLVGIAH